MNHDNRIAYLAGDTTTPIDAAERAELDALRGLIAEPAVWVEPSPSLEDRIVDAITAGRPDSTQQALVVGELREPRRPRPSRRLRYAILGAAAAILAAIGGTVLATNHSNRPTEFAASLGATALMPDASGRVTLTQTASGWRIHLHASGLPRLDDGRYYEAWLKNTAGTLVPIGTFNEGTDVTLWAGVPPSSFPTLTVTRQVANGDPKSSGQVVLVGATHRTH